MKKYVNKGISLIVLVITVIVIFVMATAIILTITNSGVLDSAKKARFMSDYRSVEDGVSLYSVSNIDMSNASTFKLPLEGKLSLNDKQDITSNVPTLKTKIEELNPGKTIDDIDLYWINEPQVGVNGLASNKKDKGYIIDVAKRQIYDYVGDFFENKRWHTLDGGVTETAVIPYIQEMWDGWMKLTLYYPESSTDKKWRLGSEGEIRVDPMLMWQDYTGPISIPLDKVKDVWIKYKLNNKEVIIPPAGTLLVDIVPDKIGTTKVKQVNVNINYDSEATIKEYKIGSSVWMPYTGQFTVTENCLIQARAKKTEVVYNTDGTLLMTRDIAGKDLVYIGNIGPEDGTKIEDANLVAPTITRLPAIGSEVARVQITYPANAVKKIYKINYGVEQDYTSEINVQNYGTHIIAYYYDANGKRSLSRSIYINDTTAEPAEQPKPYEPLPPYVPEVPIPYEPKTVIQLPPPTIARLDSEGTEKARIQITYPANAVDKYFTQNYGPQQNYTSEINVTEWGTYIMAYYYDAEGNKSQIAWIRVNEILTDPGTIEPIPIAPEDIVPAPDISINPSSGLVNEVTVSVTSPGDAANTYIQIGKYGTYQKYTAPIVVRDNLEIYAYYRKTSGEKSLEAKARVINILKIDESANPKPYITINPNPYPWNGAPVVSEVNISIASSYADKVEYSEDGIVFKTYTTPFRVMENKRIYARGTNPYGVTETYLDITNIGGIKAPPTIENLAVNINVDPEPALSINRVVSAKVSIEYDSKSTEKYYSIGKYGDLKSYTGPFDVTSNCTIYGYALSSKGKGETSKVIDNLLDGISNPVITSLPGNNTEASKVIINISYDKYATVKKYSINGGALQNYTGEFDVTTNGTTVYAYSENAAGQKSNASYTVENIIPEPPALLIDKGNYYLLKLNYPEASKGREYKWKENGEWKGYKEAGILLIKPQYKDSVIKSGTLIKIEDENGNLVTFTGDYYLIDVPISQLFENISMRWDRVPPAVPEIVINPTDPAKQVSATIIYDSAMVRKQYRILEPGGALGDWLNYTSPIKIDRNNTVIYAKAMDDSEVWSSEAMFKVTNIDEIAPVINLDVDLSAPKQNVPVQVTVTDNMQVGIVKWAKGTQGESYFINSGTEITNNSSVSITEIGYYTFYAEDSVGNKQVYTLYIDNIDIIPPTNPVIAASPLTYTNGNVLVNITYADDAYTKEYSTNGTTWSTYTGQITISLNGTTVYARAKDQAGNQSGQSSITITNIDKVKPLVTFSLNGASNVQTAITNVIVTDTDGSGVNDSTLQYVWSTQNVSAPTSGWSMFTNGDIITKTGADGAYYLWIKATDNVGNDATVKSNAFILAQPLIVNTPVLTAGMTAKKWNGTTWETVTNPSTDTTWYNYESGQWANAQTADGSMWVWIPRYIYKISSGWHTSTVGTINVQFSRGTDDNWNSGSIGSINTATDAGAANNKWTNHPGFTFGSTQLTGIWVAKFEATARQGLANTIAGDNVTTKNVKVLPGVKSWRYANISTMFTVCRNMETDNAFGWGTTGTGLDTHLMKNTEWGLVAYITHSKYGRNGIEVTINNNSSYYTGGGVDTAYTTNVSQSTTGTVYGIYDMSGGAAEYTAAYVNTGSGYITSLGGSLTSASIQYRDYYGNNSAADTNYSYAINLKGDAIIETSSTFNGYTSWFSDTSGMPAFSKPFFLRGGKYDSGVSAGLFNFDLFYGDDSGVGGLGFRPVIAVDSSL